MRVFLIVFFFCCTEIASAQYWFGPKVGINTSSFIYEGEGYATDTFQIKPSVNFEVGGVFIYQASKRYSVQGEILYEQIKKTLMDRPLNNNPDVLSKSTMRFLSVPLQFRVSLGNEPVSFYVSAGIKLKYWLGGKGTVVDNSSEFDPPIVYDKIVFRQSKSNRVEGIYAVPEANIMQFGLVFGGGMYLDLITKGRLLLDARYTFGHSNMGFNKNPDFRTTSYVDRFTYRNNTISVSLAYLFQYDAKSQKKGASTSTETKASKK